MEKQRSVGMLMILLLLVCFVFPAFTFAETILLKSGKKIEGEIAERTKEYIKVRVSGMTITYPIDAVDKIEGDNYFSTNKEKKKGNLVIVGDATNTYASYFFLLPPNWIPLMDNMDLTDKTGYWHGRHKNSQTIMEILPQKKPKETTLLDIVDYTKEYSEKDSPSGSWQKYSDFKPSVNYAYEVRSFNNTKKGTYEVFVFIDIPPEYVITFILTGNGKDIECITPHFDDFNNVISSFRWILGLSDNEIGNLLKKTQ